MASAYSLDLAFDLQQLNNPANDSMALLNHGITIIGDVGNPVARLRRLRVSDTVSITVYQLGKEAEIEKFEIVDLSFKIKFDPARSQPAPSPVGDGHFFESFKIFAPSYVAQTSTVFEHLSPVWFVELDPDGNRPYSQGQMQEGEPKDFGAPVFALENEGAFYFTMHLSVTYKEKVSSGPGPVPVQSKVFRVDPEMIVTTGGGTPITGRMKS